MKDARSLGERALSFALSILAAVWLLSMAWTLLRPLLPIVGIVTALLISVELYVRRRREW